MPGVIVPFRKLIIRYKGIFDMEGLYRLIVQWLKSRRYWVQESTYKHKVPSPLGAEEEIGFKGNRKVDDYYMYDVIINFHLWNMQEVDVIRDGKKVKLTRARMEVVLTGTMTLDYQGRFEKSPFYKKLRDFYHKYIIKDQLEFLYYDTFYYRLIKLQALVKDYLDMQAKSHEYEGYLGDNV
jgi:hypothetical protein